MQHEKKDTAKSKIDTAKSKRNPQKHFAHRQVPSHCGVYFEMRCRKYTHMLNFVYEDGIKIRNKYFPAISRILYLSKKTISRPPQSHETIPLNHFPRDKSPHEATE
jgi:hypothetical protein